MMANMILKPDQQLSFYFSLFTDSKWPDTTGCYLFSKLKHQTDEAKVKVLMGPGYFSPIYSLQSQLPTEKMENLVIRDRVFVHLLKYILLSIKI